jgi:predicted site-specific integrase-resolvase
MDRWLTITWAAKQFKIDRATLLQWAKDGTVEARQKLNLAWQVREQSLRAHLFGSTNAGT